MFSQWSTVFFGKILFCKIESIVLVSFAVLNFYGNFFPENSLEISHQKSKLFTVLLWIIGNIRLLALLAKITILAMKEKGNCLESTLNYLLFTFSFIHIPVQIWLDDSSKILKHSLPSKVQKSCKRTLHWVLLTTFFLWVKLFGMTFDTALSDK